MLQEKTILTFPEKSLEELKSLSSEDRVVYEQEIVDYCLGIANNHFPQRMSIEAVVTIVNGLLLNYTGKDKARVSLILALCAIALRDMQPQKPY